MELFDTIEMMSSVDYKERFKAEYYQLNIRFDKLLNTIIKYDANKLEFELNCDIELLRNQLKAMWQYLYCLKVRAEIEGINL